MNIKGITVLILFFCLSARAQQVLKLPEQSTRSKSPGENLVFAITPFNFKGKEIVRWDPPRLARPPDSPPYRIILAGQTTPGTVVLLDEQVPIAVDERGRYQFILEIPKPQAIVEFQAITPQGTTNNYIINLELPGRKDSPVKIARKVPKGPPDSEHTMPLNFDPLQNGVVVQQQAFEYALFPTSDFSLGNVIVRNKDIFVSAHRSKIKGDYYFRFQWPRVFMSEGTIEIKNASNKVLWSRTIALGEGKKAVAKKGDKTKTIDDILIYQSLPQNKDVLNVFKNQKDFRFCMRHSFGDAKTSFCSMPFTFDASAKKFVPKPLELNSSIKINKEEFPRRAIVPFKNLKDLYQVDTQLPNGASFRFQVGPIPIEFRDILSSDDQETVFITGRGVAPDDFSAEILARDEGWKATFNPAKPYLYFIGVGGIPIRQDFQLTKPLPHETHRVWAKKNSPESSYISEIDVDVRLKNPYELKTDQFSVDKKSALSYNWNYKLHERGRTGQSQIRILDKDNEFKAYYEAYKGFPFEMSGRLTGIMGSGGRLWLLWEIAAGAWAESIFGAKNYWLSERRWGLSTKYIKSLAFGGFDPNLTIFDLDLKYRFVPGLWNKDESVGAVLGYQDMSYRVSTRDSSTQLITSHDLPAGMLGVGLFWARSMPELFDDIFNIIPWFRYPKWVDMEGIYYLAGTNPKSTLGKTNFNLTFHGKMFFIPEFYMEASFGLKSFSYTNEGIDALVTMMFATGGLGYNF
jgi:hypothetical protein